MSMSNKQQGFTLIELMIAVTLSLLLLTGVIQIFLSSKQSYRTAESLSRTQENSRYAIDALSRDLRSAGFQPCKKTGLLANVVNGAPSSLNFFGAPLVGYDGSNGTFDSDFPAVGTTAGARVAGADAVRIIRGGGTGFSVDIHNATSAQFKLVGGTHNFVDGDIVLVCDSENSSILQITNANQTNVTIVHNNGTGTPGNCTKGLGFPVPSPCTANGTAKTYGPGSQIVSIESFIYYLGISASGNANSLYRKRLINSAGTPTLGNAEELVEGIESLQIVYGVAPDPVSPAQRYVTADQLTGATTAETEANWQNVVSVRIGLLMVTPDEISAKDDTSTYNVVGTDIASSGSGLTYSSDRRQRYIFTSTVKLRNRGTL
ncbi:PilW family protein [Sulfuriflexus sp.]|uniref:PilW family protein n=1 Tax=Sulfuriflexus sp. TaxID=2015443 RepID=UPI0028CF33B0|nr:PilW family protein [Sulfuriflexus sp.]MDT8403752.1 PilW family protein [Sulfuriflexus sp.]